MENENIILSIKNASIFQEDDLILDNVNLEFKENDFAYLIGKVGSGKSSLIKTLNAEIPLKQGDINIVGFDLTKLKRKQIPLLRRNLGIVFQDFQLLTDRTVKDNLEFVLKATGWKDKKVILDRIKEVLSLVDLDDKILKMPNSLSGGEKQRIVIARAILNKPKLILADEPTGNLDPETSGKILELLLNISKNNSAVLMATHDFQIIERYPARTLKCENKTILE